MMERITKVRSYEYLLSPLDGQDSEKGNKGFRGWGPRVGRADLRLGKRHNSEPSLPFPYLPPTVNVQRNMSTNVRGIRLTINVMGSFT